MSLELFLCRDCGVRRPRHEVLYPDSPQPRCPVCWGPGEVYEVPEVVPGRAPVRPPTPELRGEA